MKINAFCTPCQTVKPHEATLDGNGELIIACSCGHFIKAPALPAEKLAAFLADHRGQNEGREFLDQAEEARKTASAAAYMQSLASLG